MESACGLARVLSGGKKCLILSGRLLYVCLLKINWNKMKNRGPVLGNLARNINIYEYFGLKWFVNFKRIFCVRLLI